MSALTPESLARLSTLYDEVADLSVPEREARLATLRDGDAQLVPPLLAMLAGRASRETADLFDRGPAFAAQLTPTLGAGDAVGPYRLLREIGVGGMGAVWLAERADGLIERRVALKLPHLGWAPGLAERFARERSILASLVHPNIARLDDVGVDAAGRPYMALEYVEGESLAAHTERRALGLRERIALLLQVADAVGFAHARLVLHRDLKPGNVLVDVQGQVKLLDFGIAKLMVDERASHTELTQLAGRALTPDYASPEQLRGEPLGVASDVYSLGVLAFELLAGTSPYRLERRTAAALEQAVLDLDVAAASACAATPARARELRGDLDAILAKALQKDPAARYASVEALAQDWRRWLAGEGITARRASLVDRLHRGLRRHRRPVLAGGAVLAAFALALGAGATALVVAVLLAGLALALWQARAAREQARIARVEARTADAVLAFVEGLFRANAREQADPLRARRRTAEELLQQGAARIDSELLATPEARLRVLRTLAAMHLDIGRIDDAIRLAGEATALAAQLHGAHSESHLRALLDEARMLMDAERQQAAADVLARAEAVRSALTPTPPELAIELDLAQALHHSYRRDPAALPQAERAVQALGRAGPSLRLLEALRLQGAMLGAAGRPEEALHTLERALEIAATLDGAEAHVPALCEAASDVAQNQGDFDRAEAWMRQAVETESRVTGSGSLATVSLLRNLACTLNNRGRTADALALFAQARAQVAGWAPSAERDLMDHLLSMLEGRGWQSRGLPGRALACFDDALRTMGREGEAQSRSAFNPRSAVILQHGRGTACLELGRLQDAAAAAAESDRLMHAHGVTSPDVLFGAAQLRMRLALAQGDAGAALQAWQAYEALQPPEITAPWRLRQRAEIAEAQHDPGVALAHVDAALAGLRGPPPTFMADHLEMQLRLQRGRLLRAEGTTAPALAELERAWQLAQQLQDPEQGLGVGRIALVLAEVLAEAGDAGRARALQVQADRILASPGAF